MHSEQLELSAYARATDPPTSHEAARTVENLADKVLRVLKAISSTGNTGATNDDIVRITGLDWNTATPRVKPLVVKGLVDTRLDVTGQTITRLGSRNRRQIVWFAK